MRSLDDMVALILSFHRLTQAEVCLDIKEFFLNNFVLHLSNLNTSAFLSYSINWC
uniref:Uncharacterized protein n=1 Tax=Anguilla anguilla TaxID=7936 RepID=A0A0E9WKP0_ANGAN